MYLYTYTYALLQARFSLKNKHGSCFFLPKVADPPAEALATMQQRLVRGPGASSQSFQGGN